MPNILKAIAEQSRFRHKPVGPLGNYVKVRDNLPGGIKKWGTAVSTALAGNLGTFTCDNFEDSKLMSEIIRRCVSKSLLLYLCIPVTVVVFSFFFRVVKPNTGFIF